MSLTVTHCHWVYSSQSAGPPTLPPLLLTNTDDTPVPIQSPGQQRCRQGRIWCYLGDGLHPYIVYDYTPNRQRAGPAA